MKILVLNIAVGGFEKDDIIWVKPDNEEFGNLEVPPKFTQVTGITSLSPDILDYVSPLLSLSEINMPGDFISSFPHFYLDYVDNSKRTVVKPRKYKYNSSTGQIIDKENGLYTL